MDRRAPKPRADSNQLPDNLGLLLLLWRLRQGHSSSFLEILRHLLPQPLDTQRAAASLPRLFSARVPVHANTNQGDSAAASARLREHLRERLLPYRRLQLRQLASHL